MLFKPPSLRPLLPSLPPVFSPPFQLRLRCIYSPPTSLLIPPSFPPFLPSSPPSPPFPLPPLPSLPPHFTAVRHRTAVSVSTPKPSQTTPSPSLKKKPFSTKNQAEKNTIWNTQVRHLYLEGIKMVSFAEVSHFLALCKNYLLHIQDFHYHRPTGLC